METTVKPVPEKLHRATTHSTIQESPATCLFGRDINIKLPKFQTKAQGQKIKQNDLSQKNNMKLYADTRLKAKEKDIVVGDTVLVRQPKQNKLTPYYSPDPYTVIQKKGRMVIVKRNNHQLCRNTSQVKKIPPNKKKYDGSNDDDSTDSDYECVTPARNATPARDHNMPDHNLPKCYPVRENRRPPDYYLGY